MTGNVTLTFTAPTSGKPTPITLYITNTGNYTITWPTIKCSGGVQPVITTGSATDVISGRYDGTNYYLANVLPNVS